MRAHLSGAPTVCHPIWITTTTTPVQYSVLRQQYTLGRGQMKCHDAYYIMRVLIY